jgi:metal-responsive CopG/Arc/MetJ family transcriptional regulator
MYRIIATFSVSLPPEMAEELEEVMKEEHRTRSELVREALRRYSVSRKQRPPPSRLMP